MSEQTKIAVTLIINGTKQAIKNSAPKIALEKNPNLLSAQQKGDRVAIYQTLKKYRDQYNDLLPFVKGIKKHTRDITETTHTCAVYLLLCHTFQSWNSLFLLAEHGEYSAIFSIIRKIKESTKSASLFAIESSRNNSDNLNKWCSGEIVTHGTGRNVTNEFCENQSPNSNIDFKKLEAYIYQMESQHSHNSYASILECISGSSGFRFIRFSRT